MSVRDSAHSLWRPSRRAGPPSLKEAAGGASPWMTVADLELKNRALFSSPAVPCSCWQRVSSCCRVLAADRSLNLGGDQRGRVGPRSHSPPRQFVWLWMSPPTVRGNQASKSKQREADSSFFVHQGKARTHVEKKQNSAATT